MVRNISGMVVRISGLHFLMLVSLLSMNGNFDFQEVISQGIILVEADTDVSYASPWSILVPAVTVCTVL